MAKKGKAKTEKNGNNFLKTLIILIVLGGLLAIVFASFREGQSQEVKIYTLPLIKTINYSSNDGEMHEVATNVSFGIKNENAKEYDLSAMELATEQAISSVDYDTINSEDGLDYLKEEIKKNITTNVEGFSDADFNVYISGIDLGLINGYLPGLIDDSQSSVNNQQRSKQLQEMFGNSKDKDKDKDKDK